MAADCAIVLRARENFLLCTCVNTEGFARQSTRPLNSRSMTPVPVQTHVGGQGSIRGHRLCCLATECLCSDSRGGCQVHLAS